MPDSERQARTPRIMRFPQPHDPDGRPCLPTHHPRPQPPSPTSPTPTPSKTVNPRTCWPTSPASPTRERPVAGATRWSPSWAWPPPRCWPAPGRSPPSPNGLPMRLSPSGPRWHPPRRPRPLRRPRRGHHPPDPFPPGPQTRWPLPWAPGWPTGPPVLPEPAGGGRWPSTARRCAAPTHPTVTAARCTCWRRWTTPAARCWPNTKSAARPRRCPPSPRCWPHWTSPTSWSPPTPSRPTPRPPGFLVTSKQAHYRFVVKANQPTLLDRCQRLAWRLVPELDRTGDRGHGRIELRTLKAVSVHHFGFPHAAQVLQVTRKTRDLRHHPRRCTTVTVYAITSLPHAQAGP